MTDLDILRPEVWEALNSIEFACTVRYSGEDEYAIIRAELLRLATIEADALIALDCEHDWQVEHKRAEKAEAELAALRARIEGTPVVACQKTLVHAGNIMQTEFLEYTHERMPGGCNSWAGKRVRLVVEE